MLGSLNESNGRGTPQIRRAARRCLYLIVTMKNINTKAHAVSSMTAQNSIPACPVCGIVPMIEYEPGCLFASCECKKWANDDVTEKGMEDRHSLAREIREDFKGMQVISRKLKGRLMPDQTNKTKKP